MSSFRMVKLAEVGEISGGITKNAKRTALPIQRPYLSVANVHFNQIDTDNLSTIGVSEVEISRAELKPGDLMVVEGNGSISQLGRVAIWQGQVSGCLHQNHLIKVRPKTIVRSKWLLYWLISTEGRKAIEAVASSTSGLHTLSISKVGSLPVPITSLEAQESAITYIELHLSRLDETVSTLQGIQAKLKQARASILKAAVEGRLVETEGEWAAVSLQNLLREPIRNGKSAKTSPTGHGVRIATLTAVTTQQFTEENTKVSTLRPEEVSGLWMSPGDIFVQRSNTPDLVGSSVLYAGPENWAIFPDLLIRLRCSDEILPKWMLLNLQAPEIRNSFKRQAQGSAGSMPKISQGVIASATIQLPTVSDQAQVIAEVDRRFSVFDQVESTVQASLARCALLRQAILKRAFEGRLVPAPPEPCGP